MAEQLNGKYSIERLVGRGGMGEVFAGRAVGVEGFSRPVAIKRIHLQYSDERALRALLVTEACLTARLSHANIVAVHDLDQDDTGRLFLVMELVDGIDLASLLRTGALPVPIVLFITCEILRGLGHAHDLPSGAPPVRGLVHRDVSPQNMLIGWDGTVKVSDFGLAKARATTKASASLFIKGKISYMSPEQANGAALDGRSDLFSVGVVLWEMLCGTRLFGYSTVEATMKSVLLDPIPWPRSRSPGLPQDIERITMRLLERDPGRRYATAGAVIEAVMACPAYPRNGRELLAELLDERLQARARQRVPDGEQLAAAAAAAAAAAGHGQPSIAVCVGGEETGLAPPLAPIAVPGEPYPDPPRSGRLGRMVLLPSVAAAAALVTLLAVSAVPRTDREAAPAAPTSCEPPPLEPAEHPQLRTELGASAVPTAPAVPAIPVVSAPAMAPRALPTRASPGRGPASGRQATPPATREPAIHSGIHVIDLREVPSTTWTRDE